MNFSSVYFSSLALPELSYSLQQLKTHLYLMDTDPRFLPRLLSYVLPSMSKCLLGIYTSLIHFRLTPPSGRPFPLTSLSLLCSLMAAAIVFLRVFPFITLHSQLND